MHLLPVGNCNWLLSLTRHTLSLATLSLLPSFETARCNYTTRQFTWCPRRSYTATELVLHHCPVTQRHCTNTYTLCRPLARASFHADTAARRLLAPIALARFTLPRHTASLGRRRRLHFHGALRRDQPVLLLLLEEVQVPTEQSAEAVASVAFVVGNVCATIIGFACCSLALAGPFCARLRSTTTRTLSGLN